MTLKPYSPEMLDQFALRLLDLASLVREMANLSRQHDIRDFALHDKKPGEWCHNLERWVRKSRAELDMKVIDARAKHRALTTPD